MKIFMKKENRLWTVLSLILMAVVALILLYLGRISYYWFDESFTINMVRHSFGDIINLTSKDVHPPLYYFVVRLFYLVLGNRTITYHLPSIMFFMLLLLETFVFFTKKHSAKASFFILAALVSAPKMMTYALEVRMYGMSMFLILSSFILIYLIDEKAKKDGTVKFNLYWVFLALFQVMGAYTHYFAGVAAVCSSVLFLIHLLKSFDSKKKTLLTWILCCLLMFVMYLPWLPVLFRQMTSIYGNYWIGKPDLAALLTYLQLIFEGGKPVVTWIMAALFLLGIILLFVKRKSTPNFWWLALCFETVLLWLFLGLGYSVLFSPILVSRYLVMLLPIIWVPIFYLFGTSDKQYIQLACILLPLVFIINTKPVADSYKSSQEMYLRAFLDTNIQPEDAFFSFYMQDLSIQSAFYPTNRQYLFEGRDRDEAFHDWQDLVNLKYITDLQELHEVTGNIWCVNHDYLDSFRSVGFDIEEMSLGQGVIYRIYQP